ncbi:F-box only protein 33 [Armadillidium nasatum]|uniref:7-dehydrocholesterol reductase n=1 Tax=Armadillidium nasatum TaxID=96803 RepID=A0A5N5T8U9_9CRUS|nr:F-box only protein 33 [Armadillidium nasatum]
MNLQNLYDKLHYEIAAPALIVLTSTWVQVMAVYGTTLENITWSFLGNCYSWTVVGIMLTWSILSLWIPGKEYKGPATSAGHVPVYRDNGFQYFLASLLSFAVLLYFYPQVAIDISENYPQILATCNIIALVLCAFLYYKGKHFPEIAEKLEKQSMIFEFYRGMEIHPRILNVDVKQLIISRFSMAIWYLIAMVFFVANCMIVEFSWPFLVSVILLTVYLGKFYWWETGYFNTIDIIYDRAGYYLIWGCLVWVPSLFTLAWYRVVAEPILVDNNKAWLILIFGLLFIFLEYRIDWEKQYVRQNGGRCHLWLKPATYIMATYKTDSGATKKSLLITSGFWGIARHLNYTLELLTGLSWTLPFMGFGIWVYSYIIFLSVLIIHRIFRDEKKCSAKYGVYWEEYCRKVPYRMIPGIF